MHSSSALCRLGQPTGIVWYPKVSLVLIESTYSRQNGDSSPDFAPLQLITPQPLLLFCVSSTFKNCFLGMLCGSRGNCLHILPPQGLQA